MKFRIVIAGMAILYWELLLIRWFGTNVRIVAYFSNFVLMATFLGIGAGALLAKYRFKLYVWLIPIITFCLVVGTLVGSAYHTNPQGSDDFFWLGNPTGIDLHEFSLSLSAIALPGWLILFTVYSLTTLVFICFGQLLGNLFKESKKPLQAYSFEIGGSLLGILIFALMSNFNFNPVVWVSIGFFFLLPLIQSKQKIHLFLSGLCILFSIVFVHFQARTYIWSPYYRISLNNVYSIMEEGKSITFSTPIGQSLTVNNDYHQMILDLRPQREEHQFLTSWRKLYDSPYQNDSLLPEGPVLVIGAGTGNDVAAALRNTNREIVAVEIDPVIANIGIRNHPEQPYSNPRVKLVIDDARSFLQQTKKKFAIVVFGFLDSHTLLSSFSSLRLDNFIYTQECMAQVESLLLNRGRVAVTFASNVTWIDERIKALLQKSFNQTTIPIYPETNSFANGVIYMCEKVPPLEDSSTTQFDSAVKISSDNWPFLYLRNNVIPRHYWMFIFLILGLGVLPLLTLPKGSRSVKFPYFFMGAAFFLIETSNVVTLSLLFGSTWSVNILVFSGILFLILMGNFTSSFLRNTPLSWLFLVLFVSVFIAYLVPTTQVLNISPYWFRNVAAVFIYLCPVYFASIIFAELIKKETNLHQAYGSNLLGAVFGGAFEYSSMIMGFKFLLIITMVLYLITFFFILRNKENKWFGWRLIPQYKE